ncbi:putative serine dehydratase domain-containing protein [Ilyonectria sp. MPI-CAGE-AT-0026]|nr:putative serine dehydratase domain-containing protein [Ilyonectria sp. MPI-CAGE-AT-0026]
MDYSLQNHISFIGKHISALPTPALVISKPVVKANIARLLHDVEAVGVGFRPHVKTLKTLEMTRLMLAGGKYRGIIASTLPEIEGCIPLVKEGLLDEVLYGLPIAPSKLARLEALRVSIRILLMVDNEQQIDALEDFQKEVASAEPWPIFIKVDVGSRRAGVSPGSPRLAALVRRSEGSSSVSIVGFYAHAGHSYGGRSPSEAESFLSEEVAGVISAARLIPDRPILVSLGSTPTAHVVSALKAKAPPNVLIELHAGNYPCNDLQQVATKLVNYEQQAVRLTAEVVSVYPERNEALIDAGTVAISKETSLMPGFGNVVGKPNWFVARMSQEHGILAYGEGADEVEGRDQESPGGIPLVEDAFKVGDRVELYVPHACITAAAFHVYYVVDEDDIVRETWVPWKGW